LIKLLFGADKEWAEIAFEVCSWLWLVMTFVQFKFTHFATEGTLFTVEIL